MAITTSLIWTVRDVDRETSDNFIVHAAWELRGYTKKDNVGLDAIEKIRVRNFEYRTKEEITDFDNPDAVYCDKTGTQLGVIAQEIQEHFPDVVELQSTGAYTVNPDNMTWYLVNAVKELSAEVKALKAQLNS